MCELQFDTKESTRVLSNGLFIYLFISSAPLAFSLSGILLVACIVFLTFPLFKINDCENKKKKTTYQISIRAHCSRTRLWLCARTMNWMYVLYIKFHLFLWFFFFIIFSFWFCFFGCGYFFVSVCSLNNFHTNSREEQSDYVLAGMLMVMQTLWGPSHNTRVSSNVNKTWPNVKRGRPRTTTTPPLEGFKVRLIF